MPNTFVTVINTLPLVDQHRFLSFLDHQTYLRLSRTCWALKQLRANNQLWRHWYHQTFNTDHMEQEKEFIMWCILTSSIADHSSLHLDWYDVFRRRYQTEYNWRHDRSQHRMLKLFDATVQIWQLYHHSSTRSLFKSISLSRNIQQRLFHVSYHCDVHVDPLAFEDTYSLLMSMNAQFTVLRHVLSASQEMMRIWRLGCAQPLTVSLPQPRMHVLHHLGRWAVLRARTSSPSIYWFTLWDLQSGRILFECQARHPCTLHLVQANETQAQVCLYQLKSQSPSQFEIHWSRWHASIYDEKAIATEEGTSFLANHVLQFDESSELSSYRAACGHTGLLIRVRHGHAALILHPPDKSQPRIIHISLAPLRVAVLATQYGITLITDQEHLLFLPDGRLGYRLPFFDNINSIGSILGDLYYITVTDERDQAHAYLCDARTGQRIRSLPHHYVPLGSVSPIGLFYTVHLLNEHHMLDYGAI
jgi:hypothetical protein